MTCKYHKCQTSRPLIRYEVELGWHVPCYFAARNAYRNGTDGKYTETDAAKLERNRESSRKSMARKRALRREAGGDRRVK